MVRHNFIVICRAIFKTYSSEFCCHVLVYIYYKQTKLIKLNDEQVKNTLKKREILIIDIKYIATLYTDCF